MSFDQAWARLKLLFGQGKATRIGDKKLQAVLLDGEPLDNLHRVEPYGYSYRAKEGCQTYVVFPDGDRTTGLVLICGDKRYQMQLEAGEVALHDDEGNFVLIKRGGVIKVKAATKVLADVPLFETTSDCLIGGDLTVKGKTISRLGYYGWGMGVAQAAGGLYIFGEFKVNGKNVSDTHTHAVSGDHTEGVD